MTFPIPFTTTPHDGGADNADAEDAFSQIATATDVNFGRINTFLGGWKPAFAGTFQTQTPLTEFTSDSAWHDVPSGNWAACSIVLPPKPTALMFGVGAYVEAINDTDDVPQLWLSVRVNGAGGYAHEPYDTIVGGRSVSLAHTRVAIIPGSNLTGGATVTFTPQYLAIDLNTFGLLQGGHLFAIALV